MPTFLHVGCGRKNKTKTTRSFNTSEWNELRLDIDDASMPDLVASMLDMSVVKDGDVDAIYSSHNIEHLYPHEVPIALREFLRVMKPEGYAVITCPDIQEIGRLVGEGKLMQILYQSPAGPITPLDILYGHRRSLAAGNHYMAHKSGFTLQVLIDTLSIAGFGSVAGYRRVAPHFDLWVVGTKLKTNEQAMKKLLMAHQPT